MTRTVFLAVLACLPMLVHAQQPKQYSSENVMNATATVEAVNQSTRTVVLKDADEVRTLVVAGPEIRNFDQIQPGDRVVATYRQAILAEVKPKGATLSEPSTTMAEARSKPGEQPAAGVSRTVATNVVIESVDRSFDTVTFKRPDGIVRTVAVNDPKATEFLHGLKSGDEVQVTYTEATAVALQPAQ
jgi:hypothetical protein